MALIPPDAGIRMRLQNDATILQPAAPLQEIPSDLPELQVGRTFTANIQEVLPDKTFKALVAGKQLTLQLPDGAKAGDTLDLVVIDRTPRMVIARLAEPTAGAAAAGLDKYTTLSPAAKMIGTLLLPEGETPPPAALNRGRPLLPAPPTAASNLAPVLQKAVVQSGLFYESHQAQWVAGKLPLEQILQEPQGRFSAPMTLAAQGVPLSETEVERRAAILADALRQPSRRGTTSPQTEMSPQNEMQTANRVHPETTVRGEARVETLPSREQQATQLAQSVPGELRPIVQQQLDAVATQRLVWHGEAWPNQPMEWEIVREDEKDLAAAVSEEEVSWRTTLRLDTPRLGHIDASLHLTSSGITMRLAAGDETSAANLQGALPALAAALQAAGITLLSAQVNRGGE